ncbi:MAG TPA: PDZ domain-containing protein [Phycisphaerales bacterium]|nr:PDZ domain-containing protein [Phycisphaerales bacterium]
MYTGFEWGVGVEGKHRMRRLVWLLALLVGTAPAFTAPVFAQGSDVPDEPPRPIDAEPAPEEATTEAVFLEAWRVTRTAFYDPKMHGVDWEGVKDELLPRARRAESAAELSVVINDALARLKASHTAHYHPGQREYYEILDVFFPDGVPRRPGSKIKPGRVEYVGIGLATKTIGGKVFAFDVYDGGPAEKAGILAGDELLGVDGGAWGDIEPFREREGEEVTVTIRRREGEEPREVTVTPKRIRPKAMFTESIRDSASLIEHNGGRWRTCGSGRTRARRTRMRCGM